MSIQYPVSSLQSIPDSRTTLVAVFWLATVDWGLMTSPPEVAR